MPTSNSLGALQPQGAPRAAAPPARAAAVVLDVAPEGGAAPSRASAALTALTCVLLVAAGVGVGAWAAANGVR